NPRPQVRRLRTRRRAIARDIAMLEAKPRGQVAVNDEPAVMNSPMVCRAQEHTVCGAMIDSLRTRAEMVDIAIAISTPRNHAAPVASLDQAPHLRRNVLRGAWSFTPMGAKVEPLRIAICHGYDIR